MFNKQLKQNIKQLDLQIGKLSEELDELKKDGRYEVKIKTLEDLTELRTKLAKSHEDKVSDAVLELDKQIEELTMLISKFEIDSEYITKQQRLEELTKIRVQLSECKVKESHAPAVISGVIGVSAMLLVLNYEKTDIVTSKAFGMATKLFRGV